MSTATQTPQERFCEEHNLTLEQLRKILALCNAVARYGEYVCNGEPRHHAAESYDKSENAALWQTTREAVMAELEQFVKPLGFHVTYPGLYPTLKPIADLPYHQTCDVHLPYYNPTTITIIGRRWFQKLYGNTYHSVEIYVDGQFVHKINFEYGYGTMYAQNACLWLRENGFISPDRHQSLRRYCNEHDIHLIDSVTDVERKKDL